jgi:hypothetical protein
MIFQWSSFQTQQSKHYVCGYCGQPLSSEKGYTCHHQPTGGFVGSIYICHFCNKPTYFDRTGRQTPGSSYGEDIPDVGDDAVKALYNEARSCMSVNAYTSAVLSCRKLLMHIAVSRGAAQGLKFIEYVEYLSTNHYIPPDAKDWVDHIRKKGNEANHEIAIMDEESAKDLVDFIGMLLKIIYEFPAKIKRKTTSTPSK